MDLLRVIGPWIADNEALLSGMAAMIVLAGVFLSPVGLGIRQLLRGNSSERPGSAGEPAVPSPERGQERLTLKDLTAPSSHKIQFAQSDGVRIAFKVRGSGPHNLIVAPGIMSHLNIMENLPSWRDTVGSLSRFARIITFDKRGQGLSDPTFDLDDSLLKIFQTQSS